MAALRRPDVLDILVIWYFVIQRINKLLLNIGTMWKIHLKFLKIVLYIAVYRLAHLYYAIHSSAKDFNFVADRTFGTVLEFFHRVEGSFHLN